MWAQEIPLGTWRNHSAYQATRALALTPQEVFVFSDNGLFSFDLASTSLQALSRIEGFSRNVGQSLAYEPITQTLVLAYQDGTIDLLRGQELTEISLIREADIPGSKQINQLFIQNQRAYLSTDFGVVIIDIARQEIRETLRNLGPGGSPLPIYGATIARDSLFLASAQGILRASLADNLLDFNNWRFFEVGSQLPPGAFRHLATLEDQVYAVREGQGVYRYDFLGHWLLRPFPTLPGTIFRFQHSQNQLLLALGNQVWQWGTGENLQVLTHPLFVQVRDAQLSANGIFWLADGQNGVLTNLSGSFQAHAPNGPARAETQSIRFENGAMLVTSGGFDPNYQPLRQEWGFYTFGQGFWQSFNAYDAIFSEEAPVLPDLTASAYIPSLQSRYFASFGAGILVQKPENNYEILNKDTPTATWQPDAGGALRIADLRVDAQNNLWIAQHNVGPGQASLHQYKPAQALWESYVPGFSAGRHPLGLLIDFNGNKWLRLTPERGGGIWVFQENGNQSRYLSIQVNEGNLPNNNVRALAQDQDGQIWVGTDEGVAVFFSSFGIFEGAVNALTPIFEQRPLLRSEKINVIAIDGGNRKWIGTDNGLWLFNEDGSVLLSRFDIENSPLPSNQVLDLALHPQTGGAVCPHFGGAHFLSGYGYGGRD
ncbi:MAG: hypothetical protein HC913_08665 [Microscillaceae bacterium]|nr:hypothetical protein [Microscillaceae bacterium]